MLAVLLGLGTWQVQRLRWKENLIATIDARIHEAPVDAGSFASAQEADYRPARASGVFLDDHALYLLALSPNGEGGYRVLTPMRLQDGRFLLVDRGWVPYRRKSDFARPEGIVNIAGILRAPEHHLFQPQNDPAHDNWYGIDLAAMSETANIPAFLPYVLEADATPNAGGYPVGGQTRVELPNNHLGYALTWYGLALVWAVIYARMVFRKNAID